MYLLLNNLSLCAETAPVIAMFLVSMLSAGLAIVSGIRRIATMQCRPSIEDARSGTFQRMRSMMLISGKKSVNH